MKGRKYTYASKNGKKLSRIDRILVCQEFINQWPESCFSALPRHLSDHSPLILITNPLDFGPIPFRLFNSWMDMEGFDNLILKANNEFCFNGSPHLCLSAKLRHFKAIIKQWVNEKKLKEEEFCDSIKQEMEHLDKVMEERSLTEEETWTLGECKNEISEIESRKLKDLWQKSRSNWISHGDDNSKFFHGIINGRNSKNRIHGIDINGEWIQNPKLIKREVRRFFHSRFSEECQNRPPFDCPNLKQVSQVDSNRLIQRFEEAEVKNAIWECADDKAPGPDGFNIRFIKRF